MEVCVRHCLSHFGDSCHGCLASGEQKCTVGRLLLLLLLKKKIMSGISLRRYSVSPALTNLFVIHCVITPMSFWTLFVNNNADTSYSIRLSIALSTNDNVSMSVGHLDHVICWLFTTRWSTWPGNHLVPCPCVSELVRSCIPIHAHRCLPDLKFLFYPSGLSLCLSVDHFWLYQLNESIQHYYL